MKNNENTGTIRKENHKNWLKFAVTLVVCGLGGAVLGYSAAWFADSIPLGGLAESAGQIAKVCVPFAQVPPLLLLIPAIVCWRRGEALFARWDGEDEDLPEQAEKHLNWALLWLTAAQLGGFLLIGVAASLLPLGYADPFGLLAAAAETLVLFLAIITLQRRVVDLVRRFNPEKQGSVYDFQFQKKWLASCDEAERQRIGQASLVGFTVTSRGCLFVWALMVFINVLFPIGPLPIIAVFIPWALGQLAYIAACIRMDEHPFRPE